MTSFCSYISSFLVLLQEKHLVEIHKNFANNETKDSVNIMIWAGMSEVNNMNRVQIYYFANGASLDNRLVTVLYMSKSAKLSNQPLALREGWNFPPQLTIN